MRGWRGGVCLGAGHRCGRFAGGLGVVLVVAGDVGDAGVGVDAGVDVDDAGVVDGPIDGGPAAGGLALVGPIADGDDLVGMAVGGCDQGSTRLDLYSPSATRLYVIAEHSTA